MKKGTMEKISRFLAGRGFYIVLFLCVAAIGVSGYMIFSPSASQGDPLSVAGATEVPISSQPILPQVSAAVPQPSSTPVPTPTPVETPVAEVTPPSDVDVLTTAESNTAFVWPLAGEVTLGFSGDTLVFNETMSDWRTHDGIDLSAALGDKVMAVSAGTVETVYADDLMGTTVVIAHPDGLTSVYSNLATTPTVTAGDEVSAGDTIGAVGTTAIAEGSGSVHLHFEMRQDGIPVDPSIFLPNWNN